MSCFIIDLMVLILPLAYLSILFGVGNSRFGTDWRQATLRTALLWMAYLVFLTEFLSLFNAITATSLSIGWLIPVIISGIYLWRVYKTVGKIRLPKMDRPEGWLDWVLLGGIAFYLGMTALVAFLAPPNTFDSLNYHMARVGHWVQNQSIRHFVTGLDIQNSNTPGAEMIILNAFVLAGGDQWSNFIAWAAYAGSAIGAAWIVSCFGAPKTGQRLAGTFTLTLPMAIAQATSTMNDGAAAFWLLCVAAEVVSFEKTSDPLGLLFFGLAAGEAFLTKATSTGYLLPFGVWTAVLAFRRLKVRQVFLYGFLTLGLALVLNAGFFTRNLITYKTLVDPAMSELHSNKLRNGPGVISNFIRAIGQQLGTPFPRVNAAEYIVIDKLHQWLGIDANDPRTTSIGKFRISAPNFNEVRVINPLHMLLALLAAVLMLFQFRHMKKSVLVYALVLFSGLVIYSYLFKWQIFGSRLHLSLLILCAPLVGTILSSAFHRNIFAQAVGIGLIVLSLPWLFLIENRPLLPNPPESPYAGKSLLNNSREDWYFATAGNKTEMKSITTAIAEAQCDQVGIVLSGSSPEYLYWITLDAPRPGLRIEWITSNSATLALLDPTFVPCAVICESCGGDDRFNHLIKVLDNGSQQLFLEP